MAPGMIPNSDLKRRLLREVVQENRPEQVVLPPTGSAAAHGVVFSAATVVPSSPARQPVVPEELPPARLKSRFWPQMGKVMALGIGLALGLVSELAVLPDMRVPLPVERPMVETNIFETFPGTSMEPLLTGLGDSAPGTATAALPVLSEPLDPPLPPPTFAAPPPINLSVVPLGVRTIVLDPGHGGKDAGTVAPQGVLEKDIVLDISKRLGELLEQSGLQVILTRPDDRSLSLAERAAFANHQKADLFVSIHLNWIEGGKIRGVETYHLGPTEDPHLLQLAARENQASGYSLADFRRLLDGIYLAVRQEESQRLANAVQGALFTTMRSFNPVLVNRGVKTAPFVVLAATEMPAILAEVSCLSNTEEATLLATPEYRQRIAQALFQGLHTYTQSLHSSAKKGN